MMIRIKFASLLALVVLMSAPAFAQRPGGGRGGFGGFGGMMGRGGSSPYSLLVNPAVQQELALSDEQKEKTAALVGAMGEAMRGDVSSGSREDFQKLSDEQRRERFAAIMKERQERSAKIAEEFKPKFAAVLDDVQMQRLQEISWQAQGTRALRDPEMVKALGLTQEQQDKIAAIASEGQGGPGFGGGRGGRGGDQPGGNNGPQDRQARMEAFQEQMKKRDAEMKAVLTDAQQKQMTDLLGPEFDVSKLRGDRGGPDGERRGRGPRDGNRDGNRPDRNRGDNNNT